MKIIRWAFAALLLACGSVGFGQTNTFTKFAPATGVLKGSSATYVTSAAVAADIKGLWSGTCDATTFLRGDGACVAVAGGVTGLANPTGTIGLSAVNGSATTAMRSDATPPLSQSITPTWTGLHTFSANAIFNNSGGATDTKNTLLRESTVSFSIQSAADATPSTPVTALLSGSRTGTAWTAINFGNATDNPTYSLLGTGQLSIAGGTVVGSPTGGNQGAGTVNMQGCFVNGVACSTGGAAGANPTGTVGLTAVNGVAGTFTRSDASPPLSQAISPTWTGTHTFSSLVGNGATIFQGANTGSGYNIKFRDTTNSVDRGFVGIGTTTVAGAAVTDFAISPGASGSVVIGTANGAAIGTRFGPNGNMTVNAPSSGTGISATGAANANVASFTGSSTSGQSLGIRITAGTTSADNAINVVNSAQTANSFVVRGDGSFILGLDGLTTILTGSAAGNVSIAAPSSGTSALNVTGAANANTSVILANGTSSQSFGEFIGAGTNSSDYAFLVKNQTQASTFFEVFGDGGIVAGAPTGGNKGVGTINMQGCFVNGVACSTGLSHSASCYVTVSGTTPTLVNSSGCSGVSRSATGHYTVTFNAGFTARPPCTVSAYGGDYIAFTSDPSNSGTMDFLFDNITGGTRADPAGFMIVCLGN